MSEHIDDVAETLALRPGEDVLDAASGAVLPGRHDHHVHLYFAAAAATSLRVGPPQFSDCGALVAALADAEIGWIRAVGYHDLVAGALDRGVLDAVAPVQHALCGRPALPLGTAWAAADARPTTGADQAAVSAGTAAAAAAGCPGRAAGTAVATIADELATVAAVAADPAVVTSCTR